MYLHDLFLARLLQVGVHGIDLAHYEMHYLFPLDRGGSASFLQYKVIMSPSGDREIFGDYMNIFSHLFYYPSKVLTQISDLYDELLNG